MNKKIKLSIGLMLGIFTLFGSFAFATPASALTCRDVTVHGTVYAGSSPVYVWFEYGTNYNTVANGGGIQTQERTFYNNNSFPVEQDISGLSENTTYYYQLIVENDYGTTEGGINNFHTPSCQQNNPVTVSLSANPSTIQSGQNSTLSWNSTNASSCSSSWSGSSSTSGSQSVSPSGTTTYNITCTNSTGQSANASATVSVNQNQQQPTVSLNANPSTIQSGQSSTLNWSSQNANSCIPSWSFWGTATSGSDVDYPTVTTNYSISCTGVNGGSVSASATVYVNQNQQNPAVSLYASPSTIQSGQSSTLNWSSSNANSCSPSWTFGSTSTSGSSVVYPTATTSYSVTCYGSNGTNAYASATVYVNQVQNQICQDTNANNYGGVLPCRYNQVNNQPTVVLYADQASVPYNGGATVRWITTNATSCFASGGSAGWSGTKSIGPGVFYTGSLVASRTYTITCSNSFGSDTDSVTINVRGIVINNPTPKTSLVLISSSVDRNQPIVPTVDNTRPHPGDEINYTVNYQNIGTGAITGLTLQMNLPYEVDYLFSNPSNPTISGNTLVFNLGTLRANGQGTVTVRVRVRDNIPNGTNLNFPATLSYFDPSGVRQSVNANVTAQVLSDPAKEDITPVVPLGANVFGAGFLPANLFGWLLLLIMVLALVLLAKYLFGSPFSKQTITTSNQPGGAKKTTTTTVQ